MSDLLLSASALDRVAGELRAAREALQAGVAVLSRADAETLGAPPLDEAAGQVLGAWREGLGHLADVAAGAHEQAEEAGSCFAEVDRALAGGR